LSPIHAAYPDNCSILDFNTRIIFGEGCGDHKAPGYIVFSTLLLPRPS
jgi:hypothetical protein